ncbi:Membrane protein insertase YidC [Candidatus Magnetomoraceae bacterium gMMP-15]
MEQARFVIAIALSFIILFIWQTFTEEPVQESSVSQTQEAVTETGTLKTDKDLIKADKDLSVKQAVSKLIKPESSLRAPRVITVNTPFYELQITEKGAAFEHFFLKEYRETIDKDSDFKDILALEGHGTVLIDMTEKSISGLQDSVYTASFNENFLDVTTAPQKLSFSLTSPLGITIKKTFSFDPETYLIGLSVSINNQSEYRIDDSLILSLKNQLPTEENSYIFEGPAALINGELTEIDIDDIEEKNIYKGNLGWVAVENRYFLTGIIPKNIIDASMRLFIKKDLIEAQYVHPEINIKPLSEGQYDFDLFFGPKSLKVLKSTNENLAEIVNFGWFDLLAKPCLMIMNFVYSFIPNYGVAIILLTLFIKILFWPLGNKSYRSMKEMKKLQPLMTDIREKYKNNKKKMNEETMRLYKTYKVNPMNGCLPMVLQIPVFFGLYKMLYQAIELRHAPFMWWIDDLSAPDRLFRFDFSIPFMQEPYGIPVLTIIMGASMFLQQKMSPPPGDPAQAKIMLFMPIFFTFIFINFSSGLVLYWLVNNVVSVLQQYYIDKKKNA